MGEIKHGDILTSECGATIKVERLIGEGGQGRVYKVLYNGKPKALKMYIPEKVRNLDWFYKNLQDQISEGRPSDKYIWPQDLTVWSKNPNDSFGYIMDLKPDDYVDFKELLLARCEMSSYTAMINCAIRIISAISVLHFKGMCYRDLNDGNFFIRTTDGAVLVCDNDNAAPVKNPSGIAGKARYMAPSVVMGGQPSYLTDRYSLAVCLFLLFVRTHPLEGVRTLNVPEMNDYFLQLCYGTDPIFIGDPNDQRNGPSNDIPGVRNFYIRWPIFTSSMKNMFIRAFSKEAMLDNEKLYPSEKEWQRALLKYRSLFVKCPVCGRETMIEGTVSRCRQCKESFSINGMFLVGNYNIPIIKDGGLFQEHIDDFSDSLSQFEPKRISVVRVSSSKGIIALENISDVIWNFNKKNGEFGVVKPGQFLTLSDGTKIKIGTSVVNVKM